MTREELESLPSFVTEDGKRRYIFEDGGDVSYLDSYGRVLRYESIVGDVSVYHYDDERQLVTIIDIWAEDYSFHKGVFEMSMADRIENCLKASSREFTDENFDFYKRELVKDETKEIQARVDEIREKYSDEYLKPDEYFSELGIR